MSLRFKWLLKPASALVCFALCDAALHTSSRAAEPQTRPNILFFFADDWGKLASFYAVNDHPSIHDVARTPNLQEHAKSSLIFTNAFVNAPSCTPCRSSLLSGQHFWRTGSASILSGAIWNQQLDGWPLMLHDDGYYIGKSYKVWSPGRPADAPFGNQRYAYQQAGSDFNRFSQVATRLIESGSDLDAAKAKLLDQVEANFDQFLNNCPDDQPFCYWFGPTNTHRKWTKGSGKALWGIDPAELVGKLPKFLPDVAEIREDMADYLGEIAALDAAFGRLKSRLHVSGRLENTLIFISGDHGPPGFGRGKCNLYDFGTMVPLMISGPGVVANQVTDRLVSLPDLAPTILKAVGISVPANMTGNPINEVMADPQAAAIVNANDVSVHRFVLAGRERHVAQARAGYLPYPQRSLRTKDYLLIRNFKPDRYPMGDPIQLNEDPNVDLFDSNTPALSQDNLVEETYTTLPDEDAGPTKAWLIQHRNESAYRKFYELAYGKRAEIELYDVKADPDQINNLAEDPNWQTIRQELLVTMMSELDRTNDPRVVDDGAFFETPPMSSPLEKNK